MLQIGLREYIIIPKFQRAKDRRREGRILILHIRDNLPKTRINLLPEMQTIIDPTKLMLNE